MTACDAEKIIWNEVFSVGCEGVDKEHQYLIEIYNDLADYCANDNNTNEGYLNILSKLYNYSVTHFKHEEDYMERMAYPDIKKHKKIHKLFLEKITQLNLELLSGTTPNIKQIIDFLQNWLIKHFLETDLDYEIYRKKYKPEIEY